MSRTYKLYNEKSNMLWDIFYAEGMISKIVSPDHKSWQPPMVMTYLFKRITKIVLSAFFATDNSFWKKIQGVKFWSSDLRKKLIIICFCLLLLLFLGFFFVNIVCVNALCDFSAICVCELSEWVCVCV